MQLHDLVKTSHLAYFFFRECTSWYSIVAPAVVRYHCALYVTSIVEHTDITWKIEELSFNLQESFQGLIESYTTSAGLSGRIWGDVPPIEYYPVLI